MAGDRRRKHAVYIKSFIRRCGELAEGCPIVKKGLHPTYQPTGPFAVDFFHAVETAVRKWRFTRSEWWLLEEVSGDGKTDYQKVIDRKPASASGDLEFLFELVGGQDKVMER
jgi:hypothetical protein